VFVGIKCAVQEMFDLIKKGSKEKFIYAAPLDDLNSAPNPDFTVLQNYKKVNI
jgi:hypothetical protein